MCSDAHLLDGVRSRILVECPLQRSDTFRFYRVAHANLLNLSLLYYLLYRLNASHGGLNPERRAHEFIF